MIELLVVIGIISGLASLLLAALSSAKEKAYRAICMSNMRQLAIAMASYHGDFQDTFPTSDGISSMDWLQPRQEYNGKPPTYERSSLLPYVKLSTKLLTCPGNRLIKKTIRQIQSRSAPTYTQWPLSYSLSGGQPVSGRFTGAWVYSYRAFGDEPLNLGMASIFKSYPISKDPEPIVGLWMPFRSTSVVMPTKKIMFAEAGVGQPMGPAYAQPDAPMQYSTMWTWNSSDIGGRASRVNDSLTTTHRGKAMIIFADTHVGMLPAEAAQDNQYVDPRYTTSRY